MFSILIFCLGIYWLYDLWPKIPRLLKEARGDNPKVERWPSIVVLAASAYLAIWMIQVVFLWIKLIVNAST